MKKKVVKLMLRLPKADRDWLKKLANENFSSMNHEVVRSVRERKQRLEKKEAA